MCEGGKVSVGGEGSVRVCVRGGTLVFWGRGEFVGGW